MKIKQRVFTTDKIVISIVANEFIALKKIIQFDITLTYKANLK